MIPYSPTKYREIVLLLSFRTSTVKVSFDSDCFVLIVSKRDFTRYKIPICLDSGSWWGKAYQANDQ